MEEELIRIRNSLISGKQFFFIYIERERTLLYLREKGNELNHLSPSISPSPSS